MSRLDPGTWMDPRTTRIRGATKIPVVTPKSGAPPDALALRGRAHAKNRTPKLNLIAEDSGLCTRLRYFSLFCFDIAVLSGCSPGPCDPGGSPIVLRGLDGPAYKPYETQPMVWLSGGRPSPQAWMRSRFVTAQFLGYYRPTVAGILDHVFLVSDLRSDGFGVAIGGFHVSRKIFVDVETQGNVADVRLVAGLLHAEFSSRLLVCYPFPYDAWIKSAPTPPPYGSVDIVPALRRYAMQDSFRIDLNLARDTGVLHEYGLTSIENDINTYVYAYFVRPRQLQRLARRRAHVAERLSLLRLYYASFGEQLPILDVE